MSSIENLKKYLIQNKDTILDGLNYINENYYKLGFFNALELTKFTVDTISDDMWNEWKYGPTETSEDYKMIRIKESYLKENPDFFGFSDECGWSYHELAHAIIFSENMKVKHMNINSPFIYPMNTDEIYAFGFQLMHIQNTPQYKNLIKFYEKHEPDYIDVFNTYINAIFNKGEIK